jgi:penicillin amidase
MKPDRNPQRRTATLAMLITALVVHGCNNDGSVRLSGAPPTPSETPLRPTETAAIPTATTTPTATATAEPTATTAGSDNPVVNLPVDATIELSGLPGTTDVAFDSLGMPHVYGPDRRSAIFVQGYLTASMRFWEMDAFRRVATGRLSELFGAATFGTDVEFRTVFTTRDGRRLEEALWERLQEEDQDAVELAQAYADGVNAWLADLRAGRNGATLPPEYTFALINMRASDLEEWRPQDSVAIGRLQAWDLSETLFEEVDRAARAEGLPEPLFLDVFRSAPASPATVLPLSQTQLSTRESSRGLSRPSVDLDTLRKISQAHEQASSVNPFPDRADGAGSNNWIVAPSMSESGHAMLANDPHLALFNPPIWHMIQLENSAPPAGARGSSAIEMVNGVMFPGLPGIILGHNTHGAWGGTVAVFDVTDVYLETVTTPEDYPNSPRTVLFQGEQIPVLRVEQQIGIRGGDAVTIVIEVVPHHGPMAPDPEPVDDVVGIAATSMSFRWTGHEISRDFRFLVNLNLARNVEDFKNAIRHFAVGAQNWVWADVNGDIAYFPFVLVPQRPQGTVPFLPMDGTGGAEWLQDDQGNTLWLPEEKLPQAFNPPEGFLATSNNDQIGNTLDNDPLNDAIYLTFSADLGFRQERILDLLSNRANVRPPGARISLADMSAYQYDTVSLEAARLVPFLFEAAEQRPDLVTPAMSDALSRLQAWGEEQPGSPAWIMASGVDPAEERDDIEPRPEPVSDEEKADSVAASIFVAWLTRLNRAVLADDFAGTGFGAPSGADATKALLHILEDVNRTEPGFVVHTLGENGQSTLWDDKNTPEVETRDEQLLEALRRGLEFLEDRFDSNDPDVWRWGKIHQVLFQHFLGQAGIAVADLGTFPAPGGRFTVNPANFGLNSDSFRFTGGPSQRFVAVLDPNGIRAVNIIPGGNNGNPCAGDPNCPLASSVYNRINPEQHYGDHIADWINGATFEYRVSREAVAADTQRHLRFVPAE